MKIAYILHNKINKPIKTKYRKVDKGQKTTKNAKKNSDVMFLTEYDCVMLPTKSFPVSYITGVEDVTMARNP